MELLSGNRHIVEIEKLEKMDDYGGFHLKLFTCMLFTHVTCINFYQYSYRVFRCHAECIDDN